MLRILVLFSSSLQQIITLYLTILVRGEIIPHSEKIFLEDFHRKRFISIFYRRKLLNKVLLNRLLLLNKVFLI